MSVGTLFSRYVLICLLVCGNALNTLPGFQFVCKNALNADPLYHFVCGNTFSPALMIRPYVCGNAFSPHTSRAKCYKTFYVRNLRMLIII